MLSSSVRSNFFVQRLDVLRFVSVQDSTKDEAKRLLAEAEALMAEIGSGDYKARQELKQSQQAAEAEKQSEAGLTTQGLKLRCDVNGCVIVPISADEATPGLTGTVLFKCKDHEKLCALNYICLVPPPELFCQHWLT